MEGNAGGHRRRRAVRRARRPGVLRQFQGGERARPSSARRARAQRQRARPRPRDRSRPAVRVDGLATGGRAEDGRNASAGGRGTRGEVARGSSRLPAARAGGRPVGCRGGEGRLAAGEPGAGQHPRGARLVASTERRVAAGKPPKSPYPPDLDEDAEPVTELEDLDDAVADGLDWANRQARRVFLRRAELRRCRLTGAELAEARLEDVTFDDCRLDLVGLRGVEALKGARMPWNDVLENGPLFAAALGLEILD